MGVTLLTFILIIFLIVIVTRNLMIHNIRKLAVLLKWKSNILGQILGYITSMPELISAIVAGSIGMVSTSIYNVMFSNFSNLFLVIFFTLIFKRTKSIINSKFIYDYIIVMITIVVPPVLIMADLATTPYAIPALIAIYGIYLYGSKYVDYFAIEEEEIEIEEKLHKKEFESEKASKREINDKNRVALAVTMIFISIILLYILGENLGKVLETLGKEMGVSEMILGLIMGITTSIPELVAYISSYRRHKNYRKPETDKGAVEVVNNLATSNISNLTIIQTIAILSYMFLS